MKRLFRWTHWVARARYWKQRSLKAEAKTASVQSELAAKIDSLTEQLNAELWRNVERGDMFTSAAIMGGRGMVGIRPRTGPAQTAQPRIQTAANPWDAVTGIEKMEFQTEYLEPGLAQGYSRQSIEAKFLADLANRKSLNDEPTIG